MEQQGAEALSGRISSDRLFSIISDGEPGELAEALANGADPNADDDGYPLLFAAHRDPDMVRILIEGGADAHARCGGFWGDDWFDDMSFVEFVCARHEEDNKWDRSKFADDYKKSLTHALNAGVSPIVRMGKVPEVFSDLLGAYQAADALGAASPIATGQSRSVRL